MTIRQLEYLLAIVDLGSFTRAAEELLVSQPALSHQIRELEADLGGALLDRRPEGVVPTTLGSALLPTARAVIERSTAATNAARAVDALEAGELRLVTLYSVALGVVADALAAWRADHPGVRIELTEADNANELAAVMTRGDADLAVGPVPAGWSGPVHPIGDERFVAVLAPDDPLLVEAAGEPIELARLADHDWILYPSRSGLERLVEKACAATGFVPRATARTFQSGTAIELAAAGVGVALVPGNAIGPQFASCVAEVTPEVRRAIAAFSRTEPSRPVRALIDVLVAQDPATAPRAPRPARPARRRSR